MPPSWLVHDIDGRGRAHHRVKASRTLRLTRSAGLAPEGSLYPHPFRFRLNAALCFFKRSKTAKYEIVPLGIKKPATPDDLEWTVGTLQVPNRRTARIPFVGGQVKPSILQRSLRLQGRRPIIAPMQDRGQVCPGCTCQGSRAGNDPAMETRFKASKHDDEHCEQIARRILAAMKAAGFSGELALADEAAVEVSPSPSITDGND